MQIKTNARGTQLRIWRLAFYSLGFFRPKLRKRLANLGYHLSAFGIAGADYVAVWGRRSVYKRGIAMAKRKSLPVLSIEDAFIRSVKPGWDEAPAGLILDSQSIYYSSNEKSDFIDLLQDKDVGFNHARIQDLIKLQIKHGISKYNSTPRGVWDEQDYVLVIDQVKDDASISFGGASEETFRKMLQSARSNHPNAQIIIRSHPSGNGHFDHSDLDTKTKLSTKQANPWDVLERANEVYCVTSQMGFEAILAGHKPYVFGRPFYAGWGLSNDAQILERSKELSVEELYVKTMILACKWFSLSGQNVDFLTMLEGMIAKVRHFHCYTDGVVLNNLSAWKRPHMSKFFPKKPQSQQVISWGAKSNENDWIVEDGFLRSRGLGAKLVPPLSLVVDKAGIYFDPSRPSDLEDLIKTKRCVHEVERAHRLRNTITSIGISKYNLEQEPAPVLPKDREVILVCGQVEDDKSILLGATGDVKNTEQLLQAVRRDNPKAYILYKPHPDVLAGLRKGQTDPDLADLVYTGGSLEPLWPIVDHVATITSQTGFEALLRDKKVSTYGMPFYADWGLTTDYAPSTGRRGKASLDQLVHATLIDYPIYYDPKARCISTPEIIVERLASGEVNHPLYLRVLTVAQQKLYRLQEAILGKNRQD